MSRCSLRGRGSRADDSRDGGGRAASGTAAEGGAPTRTRRSEAKPRYDLSEISGFSVANTSKSLRQIKAAGLVAARRDANHVRHVLADDRVLDAVAALRRIAETHIGTFEDLAASYLRRHDGLEPVPVAGLLERLRDGLVTVIDVRPPEEYAQGHVAGALNVPLDRLQERIKDLPPDREVGAYCRGPWCVLSFEAVARLREAGFDARPLQDRLPEWRQAGFPVARD